MLKSIRATDLPTLLDTVSPPPRYLSLDCFDTLIWRNTHAPRDVFADLPFAGGGVEPRMWAEAQARRARFADEALNEVGIEAIYENLLPAASDEARAEAVAAELAAEARHCFAFAPTVALIRAARERGLGVIIVSDTYLSEPQLRGLIAAAAGQEVAVAIDRIFCSREHGVSKGEGLFRHVLAALDCDPWDILHVGDNRNADGIAPHALGVRTVHLQQFDEIAEQRLRLEAAAATIIEPTTRISVPACQPHRARIALRGAEDPALVLGHDVVGPVMEAFAHWLRDEATLLAEAQGRPVKMVFLLRDGYLPHRIFEAIGGLPGGMTGAAIELSRFTARRASFRDRAAVQAYLTSEPTKRVDVLANQLLLNPQEAKKLGCDDQEFRRHVLKREVLGKILTRSRAFADRLIQHVRREGGVEPGDTVMLVDLGYNGTVQNMIAPLLTERLGLHVAGRYLLLRESTQTGLDKRALFDARHYDNRALHALCGSIAVLEQISTAAQGSVIDYGVDGAAVRKAPGIKGAQSDLRDRVQAGALAFARAGDAGVYRRPVADDADGRRRMAMAVFARLLFLPQTAEVAVLKGFDHDVNLGTADLEKLIDLDDAQNGLRKRGLSYVNDVTRMYLPGELQPHGLPLNLAFFGANRFGLELRSADFQSEALHVPVIFASSTQQAMIDIAASPTHDGFYMMTVPVGVGSFTLGVQLGAIADWVQIEEVAFYRISEFGGARDGVDRSIAATAIYDAMECQDEGLYRCSENGLLFVPPPAARDEQALLLSVVFRPVVRRRRVALRQAA